MSDRGTWKITVGGSDLATYADVVYPQDSEGGPMVQVDHYLEADEIANIERGGFELKLAFTITQEQAGSGEAVDMFLKGPQLWSGVKTVVLKHKDYAGAEITRTITGGSVKLRSSAPIGVTNILNLTITGGKVS